jgi:hypothetical protein
MRKRPVIAMNATFKRIRPAALSRHILALTSELEVLALAKKTGPSRPVNSAWNGSIGPYRHRNSDTTDPEVSK